MIWTTVKIFKNYNIHILWTSSTHYYKQVYNFHRLWGQSSPLCLFNTKSYDVLSSQNTTVFKKWYMEYFVLSTTCFGLYIGHHQVCIKLIKRLLSYIKFTLKFKYIRNDFNLLSAPSLAPHKKADITWADDPLTYKISLGWVIFGTLTVQRAKRQTYDVSITRGSKCKTQLIDS